MSLKPWVALALLCLGGCASPAPIPGTPEFAAARVSRGFDCGLRVDRGRVLARLPAPERSRFVAANAGFAAQSYKHPVPCDAAERAHVQDDLVMLVRR